MMRAESKESYRSRWMKTVTAWDPDLESHEQARDTRPCKHSLTDCAELACMTRIAWLENNCEFVKWETARKRKEKDFLEKESELEKEVQQERELHKEKEVQRRGKVKALKSAKSRVRRMLP